MKNNYYKSNIEPKNKAKKVNKVSFILTIVFIVFWTLTGFISLFNLFYNINKNNDTSLIKVNAVADSSDSVYFNYEIFTNNTNYLFNVPLSVNDATFTKFSTIQSEDNHLLGVRPFKPYVEGGSIVATFVYNIPKGTYIVFNTLPFTDIYRYDIQDYPSNISINTDFNSLLNFTTISTYYYDYYNTNNLYTYYFKQDIFLYVRTNIDTNSYYFSYIMWDEDYLINQLATTILSDKTFKDTYQSGYDIGYYKGVAYDSTHNYDYTFLGLIGSIVDAPLNAINDMLNFNFLGINMTAFLQGLLTISLIIAVVRLII